MVQHCPSNSFLEDVMRCKRQMPAVSQYSFIMDIPVSSSSVKNRIYRNAFCARCNDDYQYNSRFGTLYCSKAVTSRKVLLKMSYIEGRTKWTGVLNISDLLDPTERRPTTVTCAVAAEANVTNGRSCIAGLIDTCSNATACPKHHEVVVDGEGRVFKNQECAACNGVGSRALNCPTIPNASSRFEGWHELLNFRMASGDCSSTENLSSDKSFCLADVKCDPKQNITCDIERIIIKLPKYAPSHISYYCLATTYSISNVTQLPNNHIYVNETETEYQYGEYEMVNDEIVKVCRVSESWDHSMVISFRCFITISSVALIVHIFIFIALPKRRNTPSKNLCSLSIALFITYLMLSTSFHMNENKTMCVVASVVLYYFLCSVCFWMNVLSLDICRTFRSKCFKVKKNKIFINYSIYAWSMPIIFVSVAVSVDLLAPPDTYWKPDFGTLRCWFNSKWGFLVFFVIPSTVIMIVNFVLFLTSVINIYHQHVAGRPASSSIMRKQNSEANPKKGRLSPPKSKSPENRPSVMVLMKCDSEIALGRFRNKMQRHIATHKELKLRLLLYSKLALIMGMTWLISFLAIMFKSANAEHIFIIMYGLQGTFIFIAFDCKSKVWSELVTKYWHRRSDDSRSLGSTVPDLVKSTGAKRHNSTTGTLDDAISVDTVL